MRAGLGLDQLPGYADPARSLSDRSLEDIADAEFATDLLHIDSLTLVGERGIAGDDEEPTDARERCDDLLDHAVDKVFLLRVTRQILERQHRDRRLVGSARSAGISLAS